MEAKFDYIAKNHSSSIHNIEVQLGRLANAMGIRAHGNLPSTTESNPKELKAITLRSGKEVKTWAEISKKEDKKDEKLYVMLEEEAKKDNKTEQKEIPKSASSSFVPKLPFPQRLKK